MNAKQQAAADLRRMSQMLKGIIAVGDELEALGSIEQAVAEAQSRIIKLQGDEEALKSSLARMEDVLATSQLAMQATIRKADENALAITATAKNNAHCDINDAKYKAEQIVAAAKASAVELDASLKDKRNLLRSLNTDITAAQSRLDGINAELSKIRNRIANT